MRRGLSLLTIAVAVCAAFALASGSARAAGPVGSTSVQRSGTASLTAGGGAVAATGSLATEIAGLEVDADVPNSGNSVARVPAAGVPTVTGNTVVAPGSELAKGFAGLNHFDQRFAGTDTYTNTNFSSEPPDQALCAGGGKVIEGVNVAFRVYNEDGTPASAVQQYNQFFGLTAPINRVTGVRGAFTSDPKCIYDAQNHRFIMSVLQAGQHPTGGFDGTNNVYFAVSAPDSTSSWSLYHFDTSHDGANGTSAGCPCLGDQPLLGDDANGIYFSVNSFPFFADGFNGAWVYAISKKALYGSASGSAPTVFKYFGGALRDGISYSIQPTTVPGTAYATENGGTEYFLSALDFNAGLDNQIAEWKLTNTNGLGVGQAPNFSIPALVDTEVYGQPPAADQSTSGPFPLLETGTGPLLGATNPASFHVAVLNTNDDRLGQAVYAAGKLWGALNTVVKTQNGPTLTGIAWFAVNPASAKIAKQGYLSANQESVFYPSLAVNSQGKGVIGATIVGTNRHPSTAYATVDATNGAGPLHVAFQGPVGEDGFTGYTDPATGAPVKQKGVSRWGDYGAAAVASDGSIWVANETTSLTRSSIANWGTFVSHVRP